MANSSDEAQENAFGTDSVCETRDNGKCRSLDEEKEKVQRILEVALTNAGLDELTINDCEATAGPILDPTHPSSEINTTDKTICVPDTRLMDVSKTEWIDVTSEFTAAAAQLAPGQLVQEANFSLFDAMSAIEVMDAKMDAALQWKNFPSYPKVSKEALSKGLVKLDGHTTAELIGVVDEVYASMVTWLEGHTLAQTVFTCLYLHENTAIEDLGLRSFSQAVIKIVEHMRDCISRNGVYAMEDQQVICLGMATTPASDASVGVALKEAEEQTAALLKQVLSNRLEVREDEVRALLVRQRFTRAMFSFMTSVSKGTAQAVETACQKLSQCVGLLPEIMSTVALGEKLDPQNPLVLGFHPVINQHLLPPSYKPYAILPRDKGYLALQTILTQLQDVFRLCKLSSFGELLEGITEFCNIKECPNVLVRSFLVMLCLQSDRTKLFGSPSLEVLIRSDAQLLCNPPSLNQKSPLALSTQGIESADAFFGKAAAPFTDILRVYCHHRARQRQRIPKCLDALGELQQDAERVDHRLHELTLKLDPQRQHLSCYGTWLLYYIIRMMIEFVVLGFEYHLYSPFEYHYVFWYLEYLYGWQQTTLKSAEQILATEMQPTNKGKRKVKKKRELSKEKERELYIIQAKRIVCVGVMRSLEALLLDKRLPAPNFEFGSKELTFKYRFHPFTSIATPNYLAYQDYIRLASVENYEGKEVNLYEAAARHYTAAKMALETIPYNETADLEGLLKVVKTNIVIMNLASQGHKKTYNVTSILDFSVHKHFPIIRLV